MSVPCHLVAMTQCNEPGLEYWFGAKNLSGALLATFHWACIFHQPVSLHCVTLSFAG